MDFSFTSIEKMNYDIILKVQNENLKSNFLGKCYILCTKDNEVTRNSPLLSCDIDS